MNLRNSRGYLIAALLAAGTSAPAAGWQTDCISGSCRVLAFAKVAPRFGPQRIILEVDRERNVVASALYTRARHREIFATNPPTYVRLDGRDYVLDFDYLNDRFPATLSVDGEYSWTLLRLNDAQFQAESRDVPVIIEAFANGTSATVSYAASLWGRDQVATFSLMGFAKALPFVVAAQSTRKKPETDPTTVIGPLIDTNDFGVTPHDLRSVANPRGEGSFVYVPKTRFHRSQRFFLWFVRDDAALKLNGETDKLTPSLRFPRDAKPGLWDGTGLSVETVAREGFKAAFGM